MYLDAKLCKTRIHNEVWARAMSPTKYVHKAVRNCTVHLSSNYGGKYKMPKKAENPFKMGYDPELDTSPELDSNAVPWYLTITGILRWMIELGRIDIINAVLLLTYHVALLREGHLEAAVHVMAHIGQRYNLRLVYDPSYPEIDHRMWLVRILYWCQRKSSCECTRTLRERGRYLHVCGH